MFSFNKSIILILSVLCITYQNQAFSQVPASNQDVNLIHDILLKQGDIHTSLQQNDLVVSATENYNFNIQSECHFVIQDKSESKSHSNQGENYIRNVVADDLVFSNIDSIDVKATISPNEANVVYDGTYYIFNINLMSPIQVNVISHETSFPPYKFGGEIKKISFVVKDNEDAKKVINAFDHLSHTCGVSFSINSPQLGITDDEQAHFQQILMHGKPSQMYAEALDMADSGHEKLALKMLDAIIERYPDDAYTAKAIDEKEVIRKHVNTNTSSKANVSMNSSNTSNHNQQLLERKQQCQSSCQSAKNSCDMNYSSHVGTSLGNTINGIRSHNSLAAQQSGSEIFGDPNACQNQYDSCTNSCGN